MQRVLFVGLSDRVDNPIHNSTLELRQVNDIKVDNGPHDVRQAENYTKGIPDQPKYQVLFWVVKPEAGCRGHHICPHPPETNQGKQIVPSARIKKDKNYPEDIGRAGHEDIRECNAIECLLLVPVIF